MAIHVQVDCIHIVGAAGSGTTTLAKAMAKRWGFVHLDIDDFYWEATDPPYRYPRQPEQRQSLLKIELEQHSRWILSGSLCGWGDMFIPLFDLVIFLLVPTPVRLARLKAREQARFAERLAPGGDMRQLHEQFMAWAASYDAGDATMRSRACHEQWLKSLPCPYLRLEDGAALDQQLDCLESILTACNY